MHSIEREVILESWISNWEDLQFVCERRNWWRMFFDKNSNAYIKIGNKYVLKKEYDIQKQFLAMKFQVAEILSSCEIWDNFIYTESKLWEMVIWLAINQGNISYWDGIQKIFRVANEYFRHQSQTVNSEWNIYEVLKKNNIDLLGEEKLLEEDTYSSLVKELHRELTQCYSYWLMHWDFNSMNLFEEWVIDLEDWYNWPVWFDLITLISHHYWFEADWINDRNMLFSFEREDIEKLILMHNNLYSFELTRNFDLCFMLRSIWSTVWMEAFPKERQFRLNRLNIYIKKYLSWENLLEYFLNEVDEINKLVMET